MRIHFILVGEGPSDEGLIPHLANLCVEAGADEATGAAPDYRRLPEVRGRTVEARIEAAILLEPQANLLFIHRDADRPDAEPRHREIAAAGAGCALKTEWVAVVPVQETEAWLLLDEAAIRAVAGRPNGRKDLNLPHPHAVESVARPKERLQQALVEAAEMSGRRLDRFRARFSSHRNLLLLRLPVTGPLSQVPAWVRLRASIQEAVARLRAMEDGHDGDHT